MRVGHVFLEYGDWQLAETVLLVVDRAELGQLLDVRDLYDGANATTGVQDGVWWAAVVARAMWASEQRGCAPAPSRHRG